MSLTIEESKVYTHPSAVVLEAAKEAILGLEGQLQENDSEQGVLVAQFHKTILGKTLGDRSWLKIELVPSQEGQTTLNLTAYPLNAVGQKLMFGARKGVLKTVVTWFYAHLDHRLPK